jgi:hypothetical protein
MKTFKLLFFALIATSLIAFSGCKKDDEDKAETTSSPLVGTWSDGNMRFVISENTITQQQNRGGDGWVTLMEGTYTYNSSNNTINTNITKGMVMGPEVVDIPYTNEDMGITWKKITRLESVAIEEQDGQTVLMFQAYFGGNTSTLIGEWSNIYSSTVEMESNDGTEVVEANMSTSLVVGESSMTITVNEFDPSDGSSSVTTESANWTKDATKITISGGENNDYLENGDYDYMIIGSGFIVEQQGPGTGLVYMVKQE